MEFTDLAQMTDLISQAGAWLCGLLIFLLSGLSLIGSLFCLGGAIVQAGLELRHHRRYQTRPPRTDLLPLGKTYTQPVSVQLTNRPLWQLRRAARL